MALQSITVNNVKAYNVSGHQHNLLPSWVVKKHAKKLKKDSDWSTRIQLIQDLDFPTASLQLRFTKDENFLVATGVYKPQFRVYELAELGMKFERHTDCENVAFEILSEDWTKMAFLQADRNVEFHSPLGKYHSVRIPKPGRCMTFDYRNSEVLLGASSTEVYRLNLDRGQFMAPLPVTSSVNSIQVAPFHSLYGIAQDGGCVEFWDPRDRNRVGGFTMNHLDEESYDATSLLFSNDGLGVAVGTSDGKVGFWDLRNQSPIFVRDHQYGLPIKGIRYHSASDNFISFDKKVAKIYNRSTNQLVTSIEPGVPINDLVITPSGSSGMVMMAVEDKQIQSFFIPSLGPAPKWASFLENMTEELETKSASQAAVYDNFKFVTKSELSALGLDHLIGTAVLRAYLHGYFIDLRLYEKAKAIANPYAHEEYLQRQKQAKLEALRESRIHAEITDKQAKKKAKVNEKLAQRDEAIRGDSRFNKMFEDPDFTIDDTVASSMKHLQVSSSKSKTK
jgi:ribosome biogenesis protein ENP2